MKYILQVLMIRNQMNMQQYTFSKMEKYIMFQKY